MIRVSEQQLLDRWDTAPISIREALFDENIADTFQQVAKEEHIPEEKIPLLGKVVGTCILGFIHPDNISEEIKEILFVQDGVARTIADSIRQKVLSPLRTEMEKIYTGPVREVVTHPETATAVIDVIPQVPEEQAVQEGKAKTKPEAGKKEEGPAPIFTVGEIASVGEAATPATDFGGIPVTTKRAPETQEVPPKAPPEKDQPPAAPFIIQKSEDLKAVSSPGFRLEFKGSAFKTQTQKKESTGVPRPPERARLELGSKTEQLKKEMNKTEETRRQPRVVHYSESKTVLPPSPPPKETPTPQQNNKDDKPVNLGSL